MNRAIIGTAEIVLSVSDLPAMRDFYIKVLGFPLQSESSSTGESDLDPDEDATITFLTIVDTDTPLGRNGHPQMLALIDFRRHQFAKSRFDGNDVRRSTLNHLAFEIMPESYESEFDRLDELGLNPMTTEFSNLNAKSISSKTLKATHSN